MAGHANRIKALNAGPGQTCQGDGGHELVWRTTLQGMKLVDSTTTPRDLSTGDYLGNALDAAGRLSQMSPAEQRRVASVYVY
jgi:hypothetical protein